MSMSCQGGVLASWACVHMTVKANKVIVNHEVLIKLKKKSAVMDELGKQPLKRQAHSPSEKRISRLRSTHCPLAFMQLFFSDTPCRTAGVLNREWIFSTPPIIKSTKKSLYFNVI